MLSPTDCPTVAPWVATVTSVTVPPLASDSKSVLLSSMVSGNKTHNQGPSIFGPPCGKPGLSYTPRNFILGRNPSRGERSEISFTETSSHVKLVNPASADMSEILLAWRFNHFKLDNPARGDISDISVRERSNRFKSVNRARGEISATSLPNRYSSSRPVKPAKGVRSDISCTGKI